MPFVSLAAVNQTAPGTFITERSAGPISPAIATFNTTYMIVECDDDVSLLTFPPFTPVQVINLDDYTNLIGGAVPTHGPALVSYNSVKQFFRNAGPAVLYVVRAGRPNQIVRLTVDGDNLTKRDENDDDSGVDQGDTVYVRLYVNGYPIGEVDTNGVYLGVPVQYTNPLDTDSDKANAALMTRDRIIEAIQSDSVAASSVYVRSVSVIAEDDTKHYVEFSPRMYGQNLTFERNTEPTEGIYVLTSSGAVFTEVQPENVTTYLDYIQAIQTSFNTNLSQGYLIAPSAFSQFTKEKRLAIGVMMENLASADEFNWFAIVDAGPSDIDSIEEYDGVPYFDLMEEYDLGDRIKFNNSVFELNDSYSLGYDVAEPLDEIFDFTLSSPGTGYGNDTYTDVPLTGGSGSGATANITVAGTVVTDVVIVDRGSGYSHGDTLSASNTDLGGTGSGFSITITVADYVVPAGDFAIIPPVPGNVHLRNGIVLKGKLYTLPIVVENTTASPLPIYNLVPTTVGQLNSLKLHLEAFKIIDDNYIINELYRSGDLSLVEKAVYNHTEAYSESQMYTTPKGYLAYYAPYLIDLEGYKVPPSPHIAGVAVKRYSEQGFQHPPAGVMYALRGVTGVDFEITKQHQLASNPKGMNAIRYLHNHGVVIWGARTRSADPMYRWVNTRIILNVLIGTLRPAFDQFIFSAVDGQNVLFSRIKATADNLLYRFWTGGALFGANPNNAYTVICDRRNNPAIDLEDGIVRANLYVTPVPTLERLHLDIIRVPIDGIREALRGDGF